MSGSMGRSEAPLMRNFPVKTARPRAAETPQRKVAVAMKKYPRNGWEERGAGFVSFWIARPRRSR